RFSASPRNDPSRNSRSFSVSRQAAGFPDAPATTHPGGTRPVFNRRSCDNGQSAVFESPVSGNRKAANRAGGWEQAGGNITRIHRSVLRDFLRGPRFAVTPPHSGFRRAPTSTPVASQRDCRETGGRFMAAFESKGSYNDCSPRVRTLTDGIG